MLISFFGQTNMDGWKPIKRIGLPKRNAIHTICQSTALGAFALIERIRGPTKPPFSFIGNHPSKTRLANSGLFLLI
jgi:hypothetical protein